MLSRFLSKIIPANFQCRVYFMINALMLTLVILSLALVPKTPADVDTLLLNNGAGLEPKRCEFILFFSKDRS